MLIHDGVRYEVSKAEEIWRGDIFGLAGNPSQQVLFKGNNLGRLFIATWMVARGVDGQGLGVEELTKDEAQALLDAEGSWHHLTPIDGDDALSWLMSHNVPSEVYSKAGFRLEDA